MKSKFTLPDYITFIRIIGSVALIFLEPLSEVFYIVYSVCGFSDILDGFIARTFKCSSDFGSILDSVSDILFYAVMLYKILPILYAILPLWTWIFVACVIFVRLNAYMVAAIKYKRFASVHTYLNKLTGLAIFLIPYFLGLPIAVGYCIFATIVAAVASVEEFIIHATSSYYDPSAKSLLLWLLFKKQK